LHSRKTVCTTWLHGLFSCVVPEAGSVAGSFLFLSRVSQAVKISYGTFSKIADSVLRGIIALAWEAAQM
jgi:hypothetical protein